MNNLRMYVPRTLCMYQAKFHAGERFLRHPIFSLSTSSVFTFSFPFLFNLIHYFELHTHLLYSCFLIDFVSASPSRYILFVRICTSLFLFISFSISPTSIPIRLPLFFAGDLGHFRFPLRASPSLSVSTSVEFPISAPFSPLDVGHPGIRHRNGPPDLHESAQESDTRATRLERQDVEGAHTFV